MPCVNAHAVIFEDGKEYVVYVSKEGYLQMREISVYKQTEKFCYLRSGLKDGDRIVDRNALLVYNDYKVTTKKATARLLLSVSQTDSPTAAQNRVPAAEGQNQHYRDSSSTPA